MEPQVPEWQIAWHKAVLLFPFLRAFEGTEANPDQSVARTPTTVELHLLEEKFLSKRLDSYTDMCTGGRGCGEFALYVVDERLCPRQVDIRRGESITYPPENMHGLSTGVEEYPADVDEQGETIGDALEREVFQRPEYVIIVHYEGSRNLSAQIGMTADIMKRVVRALAYQLWERRGKPSGDDLTDWLTAGKGLGIPHHVLKDL